MKFSIIVPVYNVEQYLRKCLDSILNQTLKDFEIIVVNDGTPDNSQVIIDEYVKNYPEYIKSYIKENGGLSDARNYGIQKAQGDYIVFVDSDDYIDEKLLERLNIEIEKNDNIEVIGYSLTEVDENYNCINNINKPEFYNVSGQEALIKLIETKKYFECACYYAYNRNFWLNNKFEFAKDLYHEDFGLIPIVILKAKNVTCIDFIGYYYYQGSSSITRNCSLEKERKKAYDLIKHFDNLQLEIKSMEINKTTKKLLNSYYSNALIYRLMNLPKELQYEYKKAIVSKDIYKFLPQDTLKEKLRILRTKFKINKIEK